MTLADIRQMYFVMLSFREYRYKMRQYRYEVKDIRRQLMRNSSMESIERSLDHIIEEMSTEECLFGGMYSCLGDSLYEYEQYEVRITEFAEEKSKTGIRHFRLGDVRIPKRFLDLLG